MVMLMITTTTMNYNKVASLMIFVIIHVCQYWTDALPFRHKEEDFLITSKKNSNGEETRQFVEDDIKLVEVEPYKSPGLSLRSTVTDKAKVWTNAVVPYVIDSTFFSKSELGIIEKAMEEIHDKTCVRFILRRNEMPYLYITTLTRCWSEIGMPPEEGIRTLSLGTACLDQRGTVVHELLHVLGFWHEQNRPDRDDYVTINWDNIAEGLAYNFAKYNADKVDTLNEPYDYDSIMHYSSFAFAKDNQVPTIEPKLPTVMIGQRFSLSPLDVRKINKLYNCSSRVNVATRPDNNGDFLGSDSDSNKENLQEESRPVASSVVPSSITDTSKIIFPSIPELVPLPFRFNWSNPMTTSNPKIIFPD